MVWCIGEKSVSGIQYIKMPASVATTPKTTTGKTMLRPGSWLWREKIDKIISKVFEIAQLLKLVSKMKISRVATSWAVDACCVKRFFLNYISQWVRALWLVDFTVRHAKLKNMFQAKFPPLFELRDIMKISLASFSRSANCKLWNLAFFFRLGFIACALRTWVINPSGKINLVRY